MNSARRHLLFFLNEFWYYHKIKVHHLIEGIEGISKDKKKKQFILDLFLFLGKIVAVLVTKWRPYEGSEELFHEINDKESSIFSYSNTNDAIYEMKLLRDMSRQDLNYWILKISLRLNRVRLS